MITADMLEQVVIGIVALVSGVALMRVILWVWDRFDYAKSKE